MKRIIALAILCFSVSAHASYVRINATKCEPVAKDGHGACIQNNTGKVINNKLVLVEEFFYRDGGNAYDLYDIAELDSNHHIDFVYTDQDFEKKNISSVVYAVNYNGIAIPGCIIQLTTQQPHGKSFISIEQKGASDLVCTH